MRHALVAALIILTLSWPARAQITIASPLEDARITPLLDFIASILPGARPEHRTARAPVIAAEWRGHQAERARIAILPNPDLAVALTNEGLAAGLDSDLADLQAVDTWRHELFVLAYDPAVIVYRPAAFSDRQVPRTRLGLTQLLEQDRTLFKRAGIVNVGISNRAYALAAQDSLRSPLFWRLAQAFGAAQARIYDTEADLLDAIGRGEIDIGYNMPLSELAVRRDTVAHVFPEDYVLSMPWSLLVNRGAQNPHISEIAALLLSPEGRHVMEREVLSLAHPEELANHQPILPGPELLVFLDQIKRSRFLDAWFQFVAGT